LRHAQSFSEQQASYARIGSSVVNHEAKRAISNTMTWMDQIDEEVMPKLKVPAELEQGVTLLQTITGQVRMDNVDAFHGCKSVITQSQIADGSAYLCPISIMLWYKLTADVV